MASASVGRVWSGIVSVDLATNPVFPYEQLCAAPSRQPEATAREHRRGRLMRPRRTFTPRQVPSQSRRGALGHRGPRGKTTMKRLCLVLVLTAPAILLPLALEGTAGGASALRPFGAG